MSSFYSTLIVAIVSVTLFYAQRLLARYFTARRLGCKPPPQLTTSSPATTPQNEVESTPKSATGWFELSAELHERFGSTYQDRGFVNLSINTRDAENVQAIFGYESRGWGVAPFRLAAMAPFCGEGVLTADGHVWEQSRSLLKPAFHKSRISDLSTFETLFDQALAKIPQDASTFDLQPLLMSLVCMRRARKLHCLTLFWFVDTSATFLLGEPLGVLGNTTASGAPLDGLSFHKHFMLSLRAIGIRLKSRWLRFIGPQKESVIHWQLVHEYIDFFVNRSIKMTSDDHKVPPTSLVQALAQQTNDRKFMRTQTIQGMIAAADTTPLLISNTVFLLARHPEVFARLRSEVANITSKPMSLEDTKQSSFLRNILRESLRLYPVFPTLARVALVDTVLPRGGGPDGSSPIFAPAGTRALSNFFALHRDKSVFGANVEEFDPGRWEKISPGPYEYMAFGVGQRACLGRQKAIAEASVALIRIAQEFKSIASRDESAWCGEQRMVCMNVNGCKVAFVPT
ncbi:cytochrome P450 [Viridothelium virens]|uniref:Cytochrome P450 n=1 Tax=Viridothelium virens TaxID=1048519 RepID=A0A6A6HA90_VIRVR|nr:cytochrome P450 [Viridothelium virens]